MTNVLIPTDFSVYSLELVSNAANAIPGDLSIHLFHAFDVPDNLIDAMHRTGLKGYSGMVTEELRLKCKQKKAQHPAISNISFRLMYGTTIVAFKNFAAANNIDVIFLPQGHRFIPVVRESVNYERMLRKSGIKIISDFNNSYAGIPDDTYSIPEQQPALNIAGFQGHQPS